MTFILPWFSLLTGTIQNNCLFVETSRVTLVHFLLTRILGFFLRHLFRKNQPSFSANYGSFVFRNRLSSAILPNLLPATTREILWKWPQGNDLNTALVLQKLLSHLNQLFCNLHVFLLQSNPSTVKPTPSNHQIVQPSNQPHLQLSWKTWMNSLRCGAHFNIQTHGNEILDWIRVASPAMIVLLSRRKIKLINKTIG